MDELFSIFTESNEDKGILYNSYRFLNTKISMFLNDIETSVNNIKKGNFVGNVGLREKTNDFKRTVNIQYYPSAIDKTKIKSIKELIKSFRKNTDLLLKRYASLRYSMSYGGDYVHGVLNRGHVYSKEINPERYEMINRNLRDVDRALDWVEKVLMDLFNMIDQDINLLTIVDVTYIKRKIYESGQLDELFENGAYIDETKKAEPGPDESINEQIKSNFNDIYMMIMEHTGIDLFPKDVGVYGPQDVLTELTNHTTNCEENGFVESKMSNEAIALNSEDLRSIKTAGELYKWMRDNIEYDKAIKGWKWRTPSEVFDDRKGNCHDQSLFSSFMLHSRGYVCGRLFFVECKTGTNTPAGNAHTFTWYREGGPGYSDFKEPASDHPYRGPYEFYWFETTWEGKEGIHGPYKSMDELKSAVIDAYNNDDDINSHNPKSQTLAMGDNSSALCGCDLHKYVTSWRVKEVQIKDDNKDLNTLVKESFERLEQMMHIDESVNAHNTSNILKGKNSDKRKLLDKMLSTINTPEELNKYMDSIEYGFITKNGEMIDQSHEKFDDENYFYDEYHLQSPGGLLQSKLGVCWDQTELERVWFNNKGINNTVIYIEINDGKDIPSHTFLVYEDDNGYYWFEHSWYQFRGIRKFIHLKDLLNTVITNHQKFNNDTTSPVVVKTLSNAPSYGITCDEFMNYARNQKSIDINDVSNEIFNEAVDINDIPDKMYFGTSKPISGKTIGCITPRGLFLSPSIAIASIFIIDRSKEAKKYFNTILSKNNREMFKNSYNIEYEEWDSAVDQQKPLSMVHMYHNIPEFKEKMSGTSVGYIYQVDVSSIKNDLQTYITDDSKREVVYRGTENLPITGSIKHRVNWELTYMDNGTRGTFETRVIKESVDEPRKLACPDYTCSKCDTIFADDTVDILDVPKKDYEKGASEFPGWDGRYGHLGMVLCPKCGERNYILYEGTDILSDEMIFTEKSNTGKNGTNRKKLYFKFVEWAKEVNPRNVFGNIFEWKAFTEKYPFIPMEMRYFYRLANPILCVLEDKLTFFQVSELEDLNRDNSKFSDLIVFAGTLTDIIVFNSKDKKVYRAEDDNGDIKLKEVIATSFDKYIQDLLGQGDILNGSVED